MSAFQPVRPSNRPVRTSGLTPLNGPIRRGTNVQQAQDADDRRHAATAENSGRYATSFVDFTSNGVGSIIVAAPLKFDTVFIEKPALSTAFEFIGRLPDLTYYELPDVSVGVMRWQLDERFRTSRGGFSRHYYVGAYVCARVWCHPKLDDSGNVVDQAYVDANPPKVKLRHHLTFAGQAYKDLPEDVSADLAAEL